MIPYLLTASEGEETHSRGVADVGSLQVARVYAEALLNAAEQAGQVDEVLADYQSLLDNVEAPRSDLRNFFVSGVIGRITRGEIIRKTFEDRAHPMLVDFLSVLNDHDRLTLLPAILFETRELRDRRARRVPVALYTAVPPTEEQVDRIRRTLRERLKLEPLVESKTDATLLGGLKLRIGDWVFDGTVRTTLEQIRDQILARGSHEIQSRRDRFSSANGN
jgi:F-type H+-transporting ATPase subunit delta